MAERLVHPRLEVENVRCLGKVFLEGVDHADALNLANSLNPRILGVRQRGVSVVERDLVKENLAEHDHRGFFWLSEKNLVDPARVADRAINVGGQLHEQRLRQHAENVLVELDVALQQATQVCRSLAAETVDVHE